MFHLPNFKVGLNNLLWRCVCFMLFPETFMSLNKCARWIRRWNLWASSLLLCVAGVCRVKKACENGGTRTVSIVSFCGRKDQISEDAQTWCHSWDVFLVKLLKHQFKEVWDWLKTSPSPKTYQNLGGGFKYLLFSPRSLGKISNLTSIFFRWVVQPPTRKPIRIQV